VRHLQHVVYSLTSDRGSAAAVKVYRPEQIVDQLSEKSQLPAIIHSLNAVICHSSTTASFVGLPCPSPSASPPTFHLHPRSRRGRCSLSSIRLAVEPFNVKQKTSLATCSSCLITSTTTSPVCSTRLNDVERKTRPYCQRRVTGSIRSNAMKSRACFCIGRDYRLATNRNFTLHRVQIYVTIFVK